MTRTTRKHRPGSQHFGRHSRSSDGRRAATYGSTLAGAAEMGESRLCKRAGHHSFLAFCITRTCVAGTSCTEILISTAAPFRRLSSPGGPLIVHAKLAADL